VQRAVVNLPTARGLRGSQTRNNYHLCGARRLEAVSRSNRNGATVVGGFGHQEVIYSCRGRPRRRLFAFQLGNRRLHSMHAARQSDVGVVHTVVKTERGKEWD
jgi:hypothetical protein